MRLVSYEEFVRMPAGTIFAPYTPCVYEEEFAIKVDTGEESNGMWRFNGVMPLEPWLGSYCTLYFAGDQEDASYEIYDGDHNDYRDFKLFVILEEKDVDGLIDIIKWAKNGCKGEPSGGDSDGREKA